MVFKIRSQVTRLRLFQWNDQTIRLGNHDLLVRTRNLAMMYFWRRRDDTKKVNLKKRLLAKNAFPSPLKNALLHPTFYLVGMTFQSTARENSIVV